MSKLLSIRMNSIFVANVPVISALYKENLSLPVCRPRFNAGLHQSAAAQYCHVHKAKGDVFLSETFFSNMQASLMSQTGMSRKK